LFVAGRDQDYKSFDKRSISKLTKHAANDLAVYVLGKIRSQYITLKSGRRWSVTWLLWLRGRKNHLLDESHTRERDRKLWVMDVNGSFIHPRPQWTAFFSNGAAEELGRILNELSTSLRETGPASNRIKVATKSIR
jgi:hypothetical protein